MDYCLRKYCVRQLPHAACATIVPSARGSPGLRQCLVYGPSSFSMWLQLVGFLPSFPVLHTYYCSSFLQKLSRLGPSNNNCHARPVWVDFVSLASLRPADRREPQEKGGSIRSPKSDRRLNNGSTAVMCGVREYYYSIIIITKGELEELGPVESPDSEPEEV